MWRQAALQLWLELGAVGAAMAALRHERGALAHQLRSLLGSRARLIQLSGKLLYPAPDPLTRLAEISRFVGITPTPPPGVAAGLGHSLSPAKMVVSDSRASSSSSR